MREKVYAIKGWYVDWKHTLETNKIGNIFRLKTNQVHWKQTFKIGNIIFRLETVNLDWKQNSRLETYVWFINNINDINEL